MPSRRGDTAGIRPYICRRLEPQDRAVVDGIPCTSVALTLLNLAAVVPRRALERACDEAEVQRLFDLAALQDVVERFRGCRGARQAARSPRRARNRHHAHPPGARGGRAADRRPVRTATAGGQRPRRLRVREAPEVDFLWRCERLVLETDGGRFHSSRRQIERDRRKESALVQAGYRVVRATWWQVQHDPRDVALMLRAALAV